MFNKIISSISTVTNQGAPSSFKFVLNEKIEFSNSLFEFYSGKPKSGIINIPGIAVPDLSKLDVSVFVYRKTGSQTASALHAMKKLVSLRHPCVLRVLDCGESDAGVFIATEHVTPLTHLSRSPKNLNFLGLFQLAKAIQFVHEEAKLVHGSVDPINVFVTDGGSFRLGGFELARPSLDTNFFYEKKNGVFAGKLNCRDLGDVDTFGFVLVAHYLAQGPVIPFGINEGSSTTLNTLIDAVCRQTDDVNLRQLLAEIARSRTVSSSLSFFRSNETVQICDFLDAIHMHGTEAPQFLESLPNRLTRVPQSVQEGVLLDLITTNVLSIASLLPSAMVVITAIGAKMSRDVFQSRVQTKMVELFSIQDRSVRFRLLAGLGELIELFDPSVLEKSVLIETLSGFTDSHPSIREQTLKAVVEIAKKISVSSVEKKIVPNVTKLLRDPEASIRTNAMVSIAKLAALMGSESSQRDLLATVLVGGLRDAFTPARVVAIQSLQTYPMKSETDVRKMVSEFFPLLCPLLLDREVGKQALVAMQECLKTVSRFVHNESHASRNIVTENEIRVSNTLTNAPLSFQSSSMRPVPSMGKASSVVSVPQFTGTKKGGPEPDFDSFWDDIAKPSKPSNTYSDSLI